MHWRRIIAEATSGINSNPLAGGELKNKISAGTIDGDASRFSVSHVAVLKWEKMKSRPTLMNWSTEKDLRLYILSKIESNPKGWMQLYQALETKKESKKEFLEFDLQKLAA